MAITVNVRIKAKKTENIATAGGGHHHCVGLVLGRDIQDTISINVEANSDLWNTPRSRWDTRELKLAQKVVVPGPGSLTFINLDQHSRLVIRVGREDLFLLCWNGCIPWNQDSHDTTSSLQTKGKRSNIKEQKILHLLVTLTTQDCSLDSSTISNGLIRVDALAELLAIEEVLKKLLHFGNSSRATNKNNIMDTALVHLSISQTLLNRLHTLPEEIHVELLKPSTVVHHSVIKVFTTKMGISSSGFHLKNTLFNGEKRDIKGATTKIKDQHILLTNAACLLVKTVSNGSSCRLIDDTHDIETSNDTGILGGLSLRVIEVSWDCDNGILHLRTKVSLRNLTHLNENH
ncbi:Glutamate dehydrogenase, NAD-specific [Dillenia turbinata]|uniref:Glutamate dehydrogenase, NAD-specific n=1 Tax=Dillenia turbinata TaxID=194707 RepID=A0AAN8WD24_9MAGN